MSRNNQAKHIISALKKLALPSPGKSLNELRLIIALERAIARLENHTRLSSHLIFKGGFVLLKMMDSNRFTRDVDALAIGLTREHVPKMVADALKSDLDDGLWFGDLSTEDLEDQGSYGGYRFSCAFQIGDPPKEISKIKKLSRIHIDMGFGDPVENISKKQTMPSILSDAQAVSWRVYPMEYIFSEKLEALFSRGSANSRAKDIYDMPIVFSKCSNDKKLLKAVSQTFSYRNTAIPDSFESSAASFDLSILRSAWRSIALSDETQSLDKAWDELLHCLRILDRTKNS